MKTLLILTPVYNDWASLQKLLHEIEGTLSGHSLSVDVLAVDDGSPEVNFSLAGLAFKRIRQVQILHLARNIGHQRAISIGLAHASKNLPCDAVIVLDSDGEDRPQEIPQLLAALEQHDQKIIFARRARRSEGIVFQGFYFIYKALFGMLTGRQINFGNFSLIPASLLQRVVLLPEIWNHYAAGVIRSGLPRADIPTVRGRRYAGQSKMNLVSLILHGLSAISVYVEVVAVRLIIFSLGILGIVGLGFLGLLYVRFLTDLAIPGWATNVAIGLAVIFFQALLFLTSLSFLTLNLRSNRPFIPAQDYQDFILNIENIPHD